MRPFDARRYVAVETAISAIINTVATAAPAVLFGAATVSTSSAHGFAFSAVPQLFMGAFMSALVPSLLTCRRSRNGKLGTGFGRNGRTVTQIVLVSLFLATASTSVGMVPVGALLPRMAGEPAHLATMLVDGAYAGLLAALVTWSALLLLFGRSGDRHGVSAAVGLAPPR